jgi:hypothetical protein
MNNKTITVRVTAADWSDEALLTTTAHLRSALLAADLPEVARARSGVAPERAKAGEGIAAAAVTVLLAQAAVPMVVDVLRSWLQRQPTDLAVEIGPVKVSGTLTAEQRDALIAAIVRHLDAGQSDAGDTPD